MSSARVLRSVLILLAGVAGVDAAINDSVGLKPVEPAERTLRDGAQVRLPARYDHAQTWGAGDP